MIPRIAFGLLAASLVGGTAAQAPIPLGSEPVAPAAAVVLEDGAGGARADASDFVAKFGPRGVEFVPALGRRAPRALPLSLALTDVRRGSRTILSTPAPARPRVDGDQVLSRRSAGIVERFRVSARGVELSYLFESPIEGDGDLAVRLLVDTELECTGLASPDGGLSFTAGDLGGVHVSGVTGIDAHGRRVRGRLAFDGTALELSLPAAFVDTAAYPLVLDPLIGTEFGISSAGDGRHPDATFDAAGQRWLVVWERVLSATQVGVLAQFLDAGGNPVGPLIVVFDLPSWVAVDPMVASVRLSGRFLVAWRMSQSPLGPFGISGRCIEPDGSLSVRSLLVSAPADMPALGGNATTTGSSTALLVWKAGDLLRAASVTVPAGSTSPPSLSTPVTIFAGGLFDRIKAVSVSHSGGFAARWAVAWEVLPLGPLTVFATTVDRTLTVATPALTVTTTGTNPAVDGDGTNFVVAFEDLTPSFDISCRGVRWDQSTGQLVATGAAAGVAAAGGTHTQPAVGCLGTKYLLAWSKAGSGILDADIEGIAIDPLTCLPCGLPFTLPRPTTYDVRPAIATERASDPSGDDHGLLVFDAFTRSPPFQGEVRGQLFEAIGNGGPIQNLGGGCGASMQPGMNGPFAIGNNSLVLHVDGVQGAVGVFLALAFQPLSLTCGPCQVIAPIVLETAEVGGNRAALRYPIPCNPQLIGGVIYLQWWVLGPPQPICPLAPALTFSDRLQATLGQ